MKAHPICNWGRLLKLNLKSNFFVLLFLILAACRIGFAAPFRFHLFSEPQTLDPHIQRNSSSNYLLSNLHRNFYWYDDQKGLIADLGEKCERPKKLSIRCTLKKNLKWSDGSPLTATDFVESYQRFLNPELKAPRASLLFKIKNAKEVFLSQKPPQSLGAKVLKPNQFEIELAEPDPDFEYTLASFLVAPVKNRDLKMRNKFSIDQAADLVSSGPYKIKSWQRGQKISLIANPQYLAGYEQRPEVEVHFIEEDSVALRLYEKNELDFLRRLPTLFLSKWKASKEFYWYPVIRFDYFAFGPDLDSQLNLRKALTHSLNYSELQKIFQSEGRPGCAGIPESWVHKLPCHNFDMTVVNQIKKDPTWTTKVKLNLKYSAQGGDDHRRAMEWIQSEWKNKLDILVPSQSVENKIYTNELQTNPPSIFRRGVAPDRPTCLTVLETFTPHNPDNFIRMKDQVYFKILQQLTLAKSEKTKKDYCQKGIEFLLDHYYLIPTGGIHFAILAKPQFIGWKLNGMNQLDLSQLQAVK